MKKILFALSFALVFAGCKKDETPVPAPAPTTGSMRVSFNNVVDAAPLTLGSAYQYMNANGDSFAVTTYIYYISNIKFTDNNNVTWAEPESYHLINQADPTSFSFVINGVPPGTYTSMSYMIGVDSARNTSGAQTGALDPLHGMIWTWSTGYIMAKFEGKSNHSTAPSHNLAFHIAGFGGPNATQRIVSPSFGASTANVTITRTPVIHINSNVQEWFQNPDTIDFAVTNNVAVTGSNAVRIANNYMDMFTVTSIDN